MVDHCWGRPRPLQSCPWERCLIFLLSRWEIADYSLISPPCHGSRKRVVYTSWRNRIMCITSIKHLLKKEFLLYKLCESRSLRSQLCALNLKMLSLPPCGRRKLLHIDLRNTDSPQTSCCCCCLVVSVVSNSVGPHRLQPTRLPRP